MTSWVVLGQNLDVMPKPESYMDLGFLKFVKAINNTCKTNYLWYIWWCKNSSLSSLKNANHLSLLLLGGFQSKTSWMKVQTAFLAGHKNNKEQ